MSNMGATLPVQRSNFELLSVGGLKNKTGFLCFCGKHGMILIAYGHRQGYDLGRLHRWYLCGIRLSFCSAGQVTNFLRVNVIHG